MGKWLKKYGEAIYDTRGGPYRNGEWGGSCHKGKTLYLHVLEWKDDTLTLPPLGKKIHSARILSGNEVKYESTDKALVVTVPKAQQNKPVTVIELTVDTPFKDGETL